MIWIFRRPDGKGNNLCRVGAGVAALIEGPCAARWAEQAPPSTQASHGISSCHYRWRHFAFCSGMRFTCFATWKSRRRSNLAFCIRTTDAPPSSSVRWSSRRVNACRGIVPLRNRRGPGGNLRSSNSSSSTTPGEFLLCFSFPFRN